MKFYTNIKLQQNVYTDTGVPSLVPTTDICLKRLKNVFLHMVVLEQDDLNPWFILFSHLSWPFSRCNFEIVFSCSKKLMNTFLLACHGEPLWYDLLGAVHTGVAANYEVVDQSVWGTHGTGGSRRHWGSYGVACRSMLWLHQEKLQGLLLPFTVKSLMFMVVYFKSLFCGANLKLSQNFKAFINSFL